MWTQSGSVSECGELQHSVQCVHTVQQPGDEAEDEEWDEDRLGVLCTEDTRLGNVELINYELDKRETG